MYLVRTADGGPSCLAVATLFLPGPRAYYCIACGGQWSNFTWILTVGPGSFLFVAANR